MKVDYLVVGLGLGGTHLITELKKRGKTFHVFDDERISSSHKAAGLINPITGRNYTKTWLFDELIKTAHLNYGFLENWLNDTFITTLDIRRVLNNPSEENKWASRTNETGYQNLLKFEQPISLPQYGFDPEDRVIRVHGGYRVSTGYLVESLKAFLLKEEMCTAEKFVFDEVNHGSRTYRKINYDHLVCCEGAFGVNSPFDDLPIIKNLGEVLIVDLKGHQPHFAYKKKMFVVPLQPYYWVGGTYTNVPKNGEIKPDFNRLIEGFEASYKGEYQILEKTFGLRPTVPDRRPIIGPHHQLPNLFVLNGLGTKGASLAPYSAKVLVDYIEDGVKIPPEISIERFKKR